MWPSKSDKILTNSALIITVPFLSNAKKKKKVENNTTKIKQNVLIFTERFGSSFWEEIELGWHFRTTSTSFRHC